MPSPLAFGAVGLSLVSFCLVISGAATPWMGFSAPNAPTLTFGLLSYCSNANCVSMTQAPYTGDLCQLKVTAALLFVAFVFSFFSFLTGAALAAGSDAAIADIKLKIVFSVAACLVAFMGTVIGCNQVRRARRCGVPLAPPRAVAAPPPLHPLPHCTPHLSPRADLCLLRGAEQ
jgi:hypothetical protein